jgi:hypothetical protein
VQPWALRVPLKLMGGRRRGSRQAGKSDPIDALAVARVALEQGIQTLPLARLDGPAREVKLLADQREDLRVMRHQIRRLRELVRETCVLQR